MNNVVTRSISGLVYVGLIIGAILAGGYWILWLVMLLAMLAITEFDKITNKKPLPLLLRGIDLLWTGTAMLVPYSFSLGLSSTGYLLLLIVALLPIVRLTAALYIRVENSLAQSAYSLMAQLYITLPMALLLMIYYSYGAPVVLLMFVMIWLNDTGAFCVGSLIGKNKLFERISPKKSWEGFFGGVVFAMAAGIVAWLVWGNSHFNFLSLGGLALLGLIVAVFATWGDLVESLVKRTLGIKDSGSIMPGHGGILDRIDSLLFVAPVTFAFLTLFPLF